MEISSQLSEGASTFLSLDATAWSAITGVGTLVLATASVVQWFMLRKQKIETQAQIEISNRNAEAAEAQAEFSREQAEIAREQARLTRESVDSAIALEQQSLRAAVDAQAPRVNVYFGDVENPRTDSCREGVPGAGELRLLAEESQQRATDVAGEELILSESGSRFIWFQGIGMIENQGPGSVRVRLPGGARYIVGNSLLREAEPIGLPSMLDEDVNHWAVIGPGEKALFRWAEGKTFREWVAGAQHCGSPIPEQGIWMWLTVFDVRGVGVIDTIHAYFKPWLVSPVQSRDGHWKVREAGEFASVNVVRMERGYVHEGARTESLSVREEFYEKYLASEREDRP